MEDEPYIDPPPKRIPTLVRQAIAFALTPIVGLMLWIAAVHYPKLGFADPAPWVWLITCVVALVGAYYGARAHRQGHRSGLVPLTLGLSTPIVTFLTSYVLIPLFRVAVEFPVTGHIQPGRPFRRKHKTQRPLAARNEHWRTAPVRALVDVDVREEVAAGWRSMAAAEAASVAAFSSLSQQLLAIGAPSEFLVMAHEDALDEIEHARLCYETARSIDGKPLGAAPFAAALLPGPRTVTDLSFAKDCLKESCVMEGAAADIARQLVPLTSPPLRAVMETIASDEARHAAHGWLMLEWLVTQRGVDIDALMDVVHQLRNESFGNHTDDRFERYGLAGSDRWTSTVHASIDNAEERLGSLRVGELAG